MTELKTLKDLTHIPYGISNIDEEELRQEAIKWVNYLRNRHNHVGEKFWTDINRTTYQEGTTWEDYDERIQFIKFFFNLTEKELK